jgi:hypothetical protein
MHSGWDARKRNRNIGTSKQGHGENNRLVIPRGIHDDRIFWEKLTDPIAVKRFIGQRELTFLVEPAFPGFVHACTIDDICAILEHMPRDHLWMIQLILLRQPKRKENILSSAWGRFLWCANTGKHRGTAICLEAQNPREGLTWKKSLAPDDLAELKRLRQDGHKVTFDKRKYRIERSLESIRATQLYRTLLHELGHAADWLLNLLRAETTHNAEYERLSKAFNARPAREKEAYAHRYARELKAKLEQEGIIPFARILNPYSLSRDGLRNIWFQE